MNSDSYKGGGRGGRVDLTGGRALGQNPYTDTGGETRTNMYEMALYSLAH